MDVVAHALWAGAAATWVARRDARVGRRTIAATVALAVLPDLLPIAPALVVSLGDTAPLQFLYAHISAVPQSEPQMPAWAAGLAHHLHCVLHSVIVAAVVSAIAWWRIPAARLPLMGWWLHILLDIPTHSGDYYPVPIFYPLTYWGFDGVAWTAPWMLALNYLALLAVYAGLLRGWRRV